MKFNTNQWNSIRYTLYVPVYDLVGRIFSSSRAKSISYLDIKPQDKILLIGAGTGLDLEYIPKTANSVATDITPAMVRRIKKKYPDKGEARVMDGQKMDFSDQQFDFIILHLILAVIPDPHQCIKEAERVLKPGGKMAVFDKFLDYEEQPNLLRKGINLITRFLFTDINRKLEDIIRGTTLKIIHKEKANLNGVFKIYILQKP